MKRVLVSIFLLLASLPLLAANIAPTGTVTSPSANAVLMLGQPMTITVNAADSYPVFRELYGEYKLTRPWWR